MVGNVQIGHQNKIVIQGMTDTKTSEVAKTIQQINALVKAGCELVRVAILDEKDAQCLKQIVAKANCPIIADIHFNYLLAIAALQAGCQKIRINPCNISTEQMQLIAIANKKYKAVIRIGINVGSKYKNQHLTTPQQVIRIMQQYVDICQRQGSTKIVLSVKSSNVDQTIQFSQAIAKLFSYPLHIGLTEAGIGTTAIVKSTIGLCSLIKLGIGDTIRVSINGDKTLEPKVAYDIIKYFGLNKFNKPTIISCPVCGRCQWDIKHFNEQIQNLNINKDIKIAIFGCNVNGVGECEKADVGIYGNKTNCVIYVQGKLIKQIPHRQAFAIFKKVITQVTK